MTSEEVSMRELIAFELFCIQKNVLEESTEKKSEFTKVEPQVEDLEELWRGSSQFREFWRAMAEVFCAHLNDRGIRVDVKGATGSKTLLQAIEDLQTIPARKAYIIPVTTQKEEETK